MAMEWKPAGLPSLSNAWNVPDVTVPPNTVDYPIFRFSCSGVSRIADSQSGNRKSVAVNTDTFAETDSRNNSVDGAEHATPQSVKFLKRSIGSARTRVVLHGLNCGSIEPHGEPGWASDANHVNMSSPTSHQLRQEVDKCQIG